jgi:hypothetical protein
LAICEIGAQGHMVWLGRRGLRAVCEVQEGGEFEGVLNGCWEGARPERGGCRAGLGGRTLASIAPCGAHHDPTAHKTMDTNSHTHTHNANTHATHVYTLKSTSKGRCCTCAGDDGGAVLVVLQTRGNGGGGTAGRSEGSLQAEEGGAAGHPEWWAH